MSIANSKLDMQSLEQTKSIVESGKPYSGIAYTADYIDAVFTLWYSSGKPPAYKLVKRVPNPVDFGLASGYPSETTIKRWIDEKFLDRAVFLDEEVSKQLSDRLVAEKVKMLEAHTAIALEMQQMALDTLRAKSEKGEITLGIATRLLIEGVRIDRESHGIPRMLEQLTDKTDEDLLAHISDLLSRTPAQMEMADDGDE